MINSVMLVRHKVIRQGLGRLWLIDDFLCDLCSDLGVSLAMSRETTRFPANLIQ